MNYRDFICYDFETTSKYPDTTQPVQIAAVVIHGRKLTIKEGTEFQSLIRPIFDEDECFRLNLDPLTDESIAIHGKTKEMLESAPTIQSVWKNFTEYVNQFNYKNSSFTAPICCGYNIKNFDNKIVNRICSSSPYKLGPYDEKFRCQGLFNPITSIDMYDFMFALMENNQDVNSLSADNLIRGYMGYSTGTAHDAMSDVIMTAELFCRTMTMIRGVASKKKFKDAFK
jgi:DNA polymerase III epsilon subunit-like protein